MNVMMRIAKRVTQEIAEIAISILLFGSLLWSLYDGSWISWGIFICSLVGIVFFILRPKEVQRQSKAFVDTEKD